MHIQLIYKIESNFQTKKKTWEFQVSTVVIVIKAINYAKILIDVLS